MRKIAKENYFELAVFLMQALLASEHLVCANQTGD